MRAHAFEFFSAREHEIEQHLSRESRRFLAGAATGHHRPFWDERSDDGEAEAADADEIRRAFDELKARDSFRAANRIGGRACSRGPAFAATRSSSSRTSFRHEHPRRNPLRARHRPGRAGRACAGDAPRAGSVRSLRSQGRTRAVARLSLRGSDGGCARVACVRMTATEGSGRHRGPQKAQKAQIKHMRNRALVATTLLFVRDARRRAARAGAAADRRADRQARRGHSDHRCDRAEGVRVVSSARRQGADVAHLVPAQHARRLADDHPAHGGAQRPEHRSGDRAPGREVSVDQSRARA